MADPTPFLSTLTGASAGLVAIIGGLLVNRFVGLDSEQLGAQVVLDQAEQRLAIARDREADAQRDWEAFEAHDFLRDSDVLAAIHSGTSDAAELKRIPDVSTPLTAEQLQPYVQEVVDEFERAHTLIKQTLRPTEELTADQWRSFSWRESRSDLGDDMPATEHPEVWEAVYDAAVATRAAAQAAREAEERRAERARMESHGLTFPVPATPLWLFQPELDTVSRTLMSTQEAQRFEDQRGRLAAEKERAEQQREDADIEAIRLREQRDKIVRPDRQLWVGLTVLLYPTVVGIVLPVLTMSGGPTAFTSWIRTLGVLFLTGLVVLLAYMAYLATRLSRRGGGGRRKTYPSGGRSTGSPL
jgi:hypothetical protein